jgi:anaerobic selenocysteine-containing dehydrogenase
MKLKRGDTVRVVGSRGTAKIRAILTSDARALRVRRARLPKLSGYTNWVRK